MAISEKWLRAHLPHTVKCVPKEHLHLHPVYWQVAHQMVCLFLFKSYSVKLPWEKKPSQNVIEGMPKELDNILNNVEDNTLMLAQRGTTKEPSTSVIL